MRYFWPFVYALVVFYHSSLLRFYVRMPQAYLFIFEECVYMYIFFYSFDTVPLVFAFMEAFIKEFTTVSSRTSILLQLLLKNLPLFVPRILRYHPFLF
jgi:hypothetical protein